MNLVIYELAGKHFPVDVMLGTAFDAVTALSLCDLLELRGEAQCSVHGYISSDKGALSGEISIATLRNMLGREPC